MNVVDSRPYLAPVSRLREFPHRLVAAARVLQGDDVGIQMLDGLQNIAKLSVAHVSVNLRLGPGAPRRQAEGRHGPGEIVLPALPLEGQPLAEGRLVHLHYPRAGSLEIGDLLPQGQRDLIGDA